MKRRYGDELGSEWDAVRELRQGAIGNRGEVLDAAIVPKEFHDLLPFASLLATGEEPLAEDFWAALPPEARATFLRVMSAHRVEQLQAWARQAARTTDRWAMFYLAEHYKTFVKLSARSHQNLS
jgi:hypothetical protein